MKAGADFFLSAGGERTGDRATPRTCWTTGRLSDCIHKDRVLVEGEPAVIGQTCGLGEPNRVSLVLSARFHGDTLFPIGEWPGHVYVSRILDDAILRTLTIAEGQVERIARAAIFRTIEDAKAG